MARDESGVVVCDAGPLIHLHELKGLDLLRGLGEICVPDQVWREVQTHQPAALRQRRVRLHRLEIIPEPTAELATLMRAFALHGGEKQALRVMQQFPDAILLTDDNSPRLLAQQLGYEVHGTIGILLRGFREGFRTKRQLLNLLKNLPRRSTLHVSATLLSEIVTRVQEESP